MVLKSTGIDDVVRGKFMMYASGDEIKSGDSLRNYFSGLPQSTLTVKQCAMVYQGQNQW